MKVLAIVVNIFLPGIGTLIVKKWFQAIAQLILGGVAAVFSFTGVGVIVGGPLAFIVWIWAIISAVTYQEESTLKMTEDR